MTKILSSSWWVFWCILRMISTSTFRMIVSSIFTISAVCVCPSQLSSVVILIVGMNTRKLNSRVLPVFSNFRYLSSLGTTRTSNPA
ncbi:hypothetical protein F5Y10DRAFT_42325 [Nemania abortiva]|nr:hypothetical protein F5Y10DRAFT_42325 [Nemania abortiva]